VEAVPKIGRQIDRVVRARGHAGRSPPLHMAGEGPIQPLGPSDDRESVQVQSKFGVAQESTEAHTVTGAAESERAEVRETMVLLSAARRWRVMAGRRVIPISSPLPGQPEGAAPFEQRECPRKDAEHRSGGD